jgi:hypothetical protein
VATVQQHIFAGIHPATDDKHVDPRFAVVAHNTMLRDHTLRPFNTPLLVKPDTGVRTLYRLRDNQECCGHLMTDTKCVFPLDNMPAPNTCHEFDQLILFPRNCEGEPKRYIWCTGEYAPLLVKKPEKTLSLSIVTSGTLQDEPYAGPDVRSYTYTWVDKFGIESAPAMPSSFVQAYDDETWRLSNFDTPPVNAVAVRIYRTSSHFETGDKIAVTPNTSFQMVDQVNLPLAGNTYVDTRKLLDLDYGTLLTEENCDPPCMEQVDSTQSGYAVGFKGNDIYFSERYEPHNWPGKFRTTLPHKIIGMAVMGDYIFIGTTGCPYRINTVPQLPTNGVGVVDLVIEVQPYDENLPCLSRTAMVATNFGALYTSHKGMVALQIKGAAQLITRPIVDEDNWLEFAPNLGAWYNGKYFGVRAPTGKGFILDIKDQTEGATDLGEFVTIDIDATVIHAARDGFLYFAGPSGVYRWSGGVEPMTYTYTSKVFRQPSLTTMSAAKIVADWGLPVKFTLYADSKLVYSVGVTNNKPFRLPPFGRSLDYQYTIEGATRIREVHIAPTVAEMAQEGKGGQQ